MAFTDAWLDELRARNELVDLVSGYVPLKQKGRRWWGLCPFHTEATPSFSVDADHQLYYCFGCHAGGSAIQFVMAMEHLDFHEAVVLLAERARMDIPEERDRIPQPRADKQRLTEAMTEAARIYHETLWTPEGAEALAYLKRRGVSDGMIRNFGLGATPHGWDTLSLRMIEAGYTQEDLVQVGLTSVKGERLYDVFRSRLMFPIMATRGKVIGFGGRLLDDGQPKYLNTSDTPLFNKRRNLYAASRLPRSIDNLWLVEGYMDVIAVTQSGVEGAVATLGTAITPEQAKLMKRYAPRVTICYDSDTAGQNATMKALDLLEEAGVSAFVCLLPDGKDPDEFIRAHGGDAFAAIKPLDAIAYRLARAALDLDLSQQEGRTAYAIAATDVLRGVKDPVVVETHIRQLAIKTGFTSEVLWRQIGASPPQGKAGNTPRNKRYNNLETTMAQPEPEKAADQVLSLVLQGRAKPGDWVRIEDFPGDLRQDMARLLLEHPGGAQALGAWMETLDDDARTEALRITAMEITCEEKQLPRFISECVMRMRKPDILLEIEALEQQRAEIAADDMQQITLANRIMTLERELRRLDTGRKE